MTVRPRNKHLPLVSRSLSGTAPAVTRKPENDSSFQKGMKCHPPEGRSFPVLEQLLGGGLRASELVLGQGAQSQGQVVEGPGH